MFAVQLSPLAADDLVSHIRYLNQFSSVAARGFESSVEATLKRLESFPGIGGVWPTRQRRFKGIRVLTVTKYRKYCIFYRVLNDVVLIVRILHGVRNVGELLDESL